MYDCDNYGRRLQHCGLYRNPYETPYETLNRNSVATYYETMYDAHVQNVMLLLAARARREQSIADAPCRVAVPTPATEEPMSCTPIDNAGEPTDSALPEGLAGPIVPIDGLQTFPPSTKHVCTGIDPSPSVNTLCRHHASHNYICVLGEAKITDGPCTACGCPAEDHFVADAV